MRLVSAEPDERSSVSVFVPSVKSLSFYLKREGKFCGLSLPCFSHPSCGTCRGRRSLSDLLFTYSLYFFFICNPTFNSQSSLLHRHGDYPARITMQPPLISCVSCLKESMLLSVAFKSSCTYSFTLR